MLAATLRGAGARGAVLLHGFLGSGRNLGAIARRWLEREPDRRLLLPDLLGHGRSPPLPPGADLATLAAAVGERIAHTFAAPVPVVGHSLGGRVALALAERSPALVEQVVLLDIAPGRLVGRASGVDRVLGAVLAAPAEGRTREELRRALTQQGLEADLVEWLLTSVTAEGGVYRWRVDRRALAALHARGLEADLWPLVERGAPRVHLVAGALSPYVEAEDLARVAQAGGSAALVPGAGHFLHVDQPERTLQEILRALAP